MKSLISSKLNFITRGIGKSDQALELMIWLFM